MRLQRFSLGVAGVLAASLFSLTAHANKNGITGYSGKAGSTVTCMSSSCHGAKPSALVPTVTLTGPTSLAAGTTGNYTLTITGGPAVKGGMDVAVNGGTLNTSGTDLKAFGGELTHTAPKAFNSGTVTFDFSLVAPSSSRTITMYASGNSTDGSNTNDGDHSASTTLDIQVTGSSTAPDAGTPDAGTDNPPPTDNNTDKGGCAAAGGAPMALLLAFVAERLRRRRTA